MSIILPNLNHSFVPVPVPVPVPDSGSVSGFRISGFSIRPLQSWHSFLCQQMQICTCINVLDHKFSFTRYFPVFNFIASYENIIKKNKCFASVLINIPCFETFD